MYFFLHQSLGVEGGFDVEKPKVKIYLFIYLFITDSLHCITSK